MVAARAPEWFEIAAIGAGRRAVLALAVGALVGCGAAREAPREPTAEPVTLAVVNAGAVPLRCTIIFGHWVEQGAGEVGPGAVAKIDLQRQAVDGALFVPRRDGRRMMIENLICGPLSEWWARRADISLLPVRGGAAPEYAARCRFDGSRARCSEFRAAGR